MVGCGLLPQPRRKHIRLSGNQSIPSDKPFAKLRLDAAQTDFPKNTPALCNNRLLIISGLNCCLFRNRHIRDKALQERNNLSVFTKKGLNEGKIKLLD